MRTNKLLNILLSVILHLTFSRTAFCYASEQINSDRKNEVYNLVDQYFDQKMPKHKFKNQIVKLSELNEFTSETMTYLVAFEKQENFQFINQLKFPKPALLPEPESWYQKNKKWAVPAGILSLLAVGYLSSKYELNLGVIRF